VQAVALLVLQARLLVPL
jgi:hypothetical protein